MHKDRVYGDMLFCYTESSAIGFYPRHGPLVDEGCRRADFESFAWFDLAQLVVFREPVRLGCLGV